MKTLRTALQILGAVALLWSVSVSVSVAAPANKQKAVAKKKQIEAQNRAKSLAASKTASKKVAEARDKGTSKTASTVSTKATKTATSTQKDSSATATAVANTSAATTTVATETSAETVTNTASQNVKNVEVKKEEAKDTALAAVAHTNIEKGQKLYKTCSVCHGSDGRKVAPGQLDGRNILTRNYDELVNELLAYRDGTANNGGLEVIMTANMEGWTDEEIYEVSRYVMQLASKYGKDATKNDKTNIAKQNKKR